MTTAVAEQQSNGVAPTEVVEPSLEAQLHQQVVNLRARLDAMSNEWDADLLHIGTELNEEAERRDWCEDYDNVIASINGRLHRPLPMPQREEEYEVRVSGYVRVPFSYCVSISHDRGDEEGACERAESYFCENISLRDLGLDLNEGEIEDGVECEID